MFKSISELEAKANNVLRGYAEWVSNMERGPLHGEREATAGDIYSLRSSAEQYRFNASLVRDDPGWAGLPSDVRDDVVSLIEEVDALGSDMDAALDADSVWADLDEPTRRRHAIDLPVSAAKKAGIANRISLRTRKGRK